METLRRISGKFSRRQQDNAGASVASNPAPTMQNAEPKLTVDVRSQASPEPAATQAEEDAPRSPLTGKPLSPRAQQIRAHLAEELSQGPVIF